MPIPRLADDLARRAPGIVLQAMDLFPNDDVGARERHAADLVLMPRAAFPDRAEARPTFRSSVVLGARPGHPRLSHRDERDGVPMDPFCDPGHVLMSPEGELTAMGDAALAAQ